MDAAYSEDAPEHNWEIDPSTLEIGPKVGQGEFGSVHKARLPTRNLHMETNSFSQLLVGGCCRQLLTVTARRCSDNCCVIRITVFDRRLGGWALL